MGEGGHKCQATYSKWQLMEVGAGVRENDAVRHEPFFPEEPIQNQEKCANGPKRNSTGKQLPASFL